MPAGKALCSCDTVRRLGKPLGLILLYFLFSVTLLFYNKTTTNVYHLPLVFTLIHLVVKFMAASWIRATWECCKNEDRVVLPWSVNVKQVAVTGVTAGLDIALSNWSLSFITVSLYTMTKSTALVFVLIFGLIFKVETFRWLQLVVIVSISAGLVLFTYESTQFVLQGFLMCLAAALCSGVRWSLSQLLTQKEELGLHNPIDTMYHVQPWMMTVLTPMVFALEGVKFSASEGFLGYTDSRLFATHVAIMLGGAVLAFFLEFSEYLLVSNTSSLTMAVSSVAKEICTLLLAEKVYGDSMSWINRIGLAVCFVGIAVHVLLKVTHKGGSRNTSDRGSVHDGFRAPEAARPLLLAPDTDDDGGHSQYVESSTI